MIYIIIEKVNILHYKYIFFESLRGIETLDNSNRILSVIIAYNVLLTCP